MPDKQHCARCKQQLTHDEVEYYGANCEHCETDYMYRLNEVSGWRWWIRKLKYWWRRFTAPAFFGFDFIDRD